MYVLNHHQVPSPPPMGVKHGDPPRPRNSWIFYRNEQQTLLCKEALLSGKTLSQPELSKIFSAKWRTLSEEEKRPYIEMAKQEKIRHAVRYPGYKFRPRYRPPRQANREKLARQKQVREKRDDRAMKKVMHPNVSIMPPSTVNDSERSVKRKVSQLQDKTTTATQTHPEGSKRPRGESLHEYEETEAFSECESEDLPETIEETGARPRRDFQSQRDIIEDAPRTAIRRSPLSTIEENVIKAFRAHYKAQDESWAREEELSEIRKEPRAPLNRVRRIHHGHREKSDIELPSIGKKDHVNSEIIIMEKDTSGAFRHRDKRVEERRNATHSAAARGKLNPVHGERMDKGENVNPSSRARSIIFSDLNGVPFVMPPARGSEGGAPQTLNTNPKPDRGPLTEEATSITEPSDSDWGEDSQPGANIEQGEYDVIISELTGER